MGLIRRAITDELGKRSIYLPPTDFEELHGRLVELAIGLAYDHDQAKGTLSYATRAYRLARWRTLDYIRRERIPAANRHAELEGNEPDQLDVDDIVATRQQRQAWAAAADRAGLTLTAWLIVTLDTASAA